MTREERLAVLLASLRFAGMHSRQVEIARLRILCDKTEDTLITFEDQLARPPEVVKFWIDSWNGPGNELHVDNELAYLKRRFEEKST